jgi:hypothetical protein
MPSRLQPAFRLIAIPSALLSLGILGCGGASDGLPRQAVYGRVTLDGHPLARGSIAFDPAEAGQPHPVSVGAIIQGGSYAISSAAGPTPGKYRVAILSVDSAESETPESPGAPPKPTAAKPSIPDRYNANSRLTADVTSGGANYFSFELTTK